MTRQPEERTDEQSGRRGRQAARERQPPPVMSRLVSAQPRQGLGGLLSAARMYHHARQLPQITEQIATPPAGGEVRLDLRHLGGRELAIVVPLDLRLERATHPELFGFIA